MSGFANAGDCGNNNVGGMGEATRMAGVLKTSGSSYTESISSVQAADEMKWVTELYSFPNKHSQHNGIVDQIYKTSPCAISIGWLTERYERYAYVMALVRKNYKDQIDGHLHLWQDCKDLDDSRRHLVTALETAVPSSNLVQRVSEMYKANSSDKIWSLYASSIRDFSAHECGHLGPPAAASWFSVNAMIIIDTIGKARFGNEWLSAKQNISSKYQIPDVPGLIQFVGKELPTFVRSMSLKLSTERGSVKCAPLTN